VRNILFFVLVLIAACGCVVAREPVRTSNQSTVTTIELHGDVAFTPEERASIKAAADIWRFQTNGLADVHLIWDLDPDSPTSIRKHAMDAVLLKRTSKSEIVQEYDDEVCGPAGQLFGGCGVLGWVNVPGGYLNKLESGEDVPGRWQMNLVGDRIEGRVTNVAMHELGHMLGLRHVADSYALMYPRTMPYKRACLSKADLSEFCRVNQCGHTQMYACEE
jgi:hypothetical protein